MIWNWKSAVLSAALRTPIFFVTTLDAGLVQAAAVAWHDLLFRLTAAGFFGALVQLATTVRPPAVGTGAALIGVPILAHAGELAVHGHFGAPHLTVTLAVSIMVTVATTAFDLYAMRRGVFVVGAGSGALSADLTRLPGLFLDLIRGRWRSRCADVTLPR